MVQILTKGCRAGGAGCGGGTGAGGFGIGGCSGGIGCEGADGGTGVWLRRLLTITSPSITMWFITSIGTLWLNSQKC